MKPNFPDSILLACWPSQDALAQDLDLDPVLMEFGGKPLLLRSVERLVSLGGRDILVVLGDRPEACRAVLGSGERWGCRIRYCYAGDGVRPLGILEDYLSGGTGDCIVAAADTVVVSDLSSRGAHAVCFVSEGTLHWSGWARLPRQHARALLTGARDRDDLDRRILGDASLGRVWDRGPISSRTSTLMLDAVARVLSAPSGVFGILRKPLREGVWVGSACRVHPEAKILAPAYIGNHVWIGKGAVVGPNAIVGDGCVVDQSSVVRSSLVSPGTYLGKGVEVDRAIVCGNRMANVRLAAAVRIPDKALLGGIGPDHTRRLRATWTQRALAAVLWIVLWPFARVLGRRPAGGSDGTGTPIGTVDRRGGMLQAMQVRFQPMHDALCKGVPGGWAAHFAKAFHPGLLDVVTGRVSMIGPEPRTLPELAALPGYWKSLYRKAMPGLINEAAVLGPEAGSAEMRFACDALASRPWSIAQSIALLRKYLGRVASEVSTSQLSRLRKSFARGDDRSIPVASGRA